MEGFRLEQFCFTLLHSSDSRELWHPELEVIFLLQGTGRVYFPDLKTAYTLRQRDIFAVNGFEVLDFELDEGAAALSFSVTPEFVGNVSPELLKYKVSCRSFLYVEEKQTAFDVLRQDRRRRWHGHCHGHPGRRRLCGYCRCPDRSRPVRHSEPVPAGPPALHDRHAHPVLLLQAG